VIDVRKLEAALVRAGATADTVPAAWEGARIRTQVSRSVFAWYGDFLTVYQSPLPTLDVPVGIPLNDLAAKVFLALGVPADQADAVGLAYAINPAYLLHEQVDERESVERVRLRTGDAWMRTYTTARGTVELASITRTSGDRFYVVGSRSREHAIAVAEGLL